MASRTRQTGRSAKAGYLHHVLGVIVGAYLVLSTGIAAAQTGEIYRLRPGDVISITVLEDAALNRQVLVAPDGRIAMPLAGSVMAARRTLQQVAGTIKGLLRPRFVDPPTVTVSLVSVAERRAPEEEKPVLAEVYVLGEVARPGRYEYDSARPITILKALTLAGGPNQFAAIQRIQIRERVGADETLRLFDYEAASDGVVDAARDLAALADGAVIIVPERGLFE